MLQSIRNKASSWFVLVLIFFALFALTFFGITDYFTARTETFVAKVGKAEIDQNEFRERFEQWRQSMRRMMGENFDPRFFEQPSLRRQVLDQMVDEQVLLQANDRLGLVVPASRMQSEIMNIQAFQVNGRFDPETYRNLLSMQRMSPATFESRLRDELAARELPTAVQESAVVTTAEVDAYLKLSEQTRDFRFVRVGEPAEPVSEDVADDEVQAFYDEHSGEFMRPETVTIEYVEISAADMPAPAEPSEETLRERYEAEKSRFGTAEQRQASHILVQTEGDDADAQRAALARAEELAAQARAEGADFAALARENSADMGSREQGGDLGWLERGLTDPAFEEALFALEKGSISDPVRTDEGYHVIWLRDVREASQKPFEEVREELKAEQLQAERERLYSDRSGELIDLIYEHPDSLQPAAEALGLEVKTAGPYARDSSEGLFVHPAVREAAFSDEVLLEGNVSDAINIGDNHVAALRVTEHAKSEPKPLADVRADIVARILAQRRSDALKARADALYARLRGGETLEALAAELETEPQAAQGVGRAALEPDQAIVGEAFRLPRPQGDAPVRHLAAVGDGYALIELTAVKDGDPAAVPEARRTQVRTELQQSYARAESQDLLQVLRSETEITIAEDRLQ